MVIMMVAGKLLLLTSLIYKIDQINGQIWMACVKICVMWQLLWDRVFTASCPSIPLPNEIMNELIECHVPHSQDPYYGKNFNDTNVGKEGSKFATCFLLLLFWLLLRQQQGSCKKTKTTNEYQIQTAKTIWAENLSDENVKYILQMLRKFPNEHGNRLKILEDGLCHFFSYLVIG